MARALSLLLPATLLAQLAPGGTAAGHGPAAAAADSSSLFQFDSLVGIDGAAVSLAALAGNVTLVINVASF